MEFYFFFMYILSLIGPEEHDAFGFEWSTCLQFVLFIVFVVDAFLSLPLPHLHSVFFFPPPLPLPLLYFSHCIGTDTPLRVATMPFAEFASRELKHRRRELVRPLQCAALHSINAINCWMNCCCLFSLFFLGVFMYALNVVIPVYFLPYYSLQHEIARLDYVVDRSTGFKVSDKPCPSCKGRNVEQFDLSSRRGIPKADTWGSKDDEADVYRYECLGCGFKWLVRQS